MLVIVLSLLVCWCAAEGLESPADQFQTWLLIEDQVPSGDLLLRRITPKSVFIAPPINKCPEGYRTDSMGRCVKIVKVDQANQWEFFLQKLNSMFAFPPAEPSSSSGSSPSANSVPSSNEEDRGPFQVSIPFIKQNSSAKETPSTSPAPTEAPSSSSPSVTSPTGTHVSIQPQDPSISLQISSATETELPTTISEFNDVNTYIVTTESPDTNDSGEEGVTAADERLTTNSSTSVGGSSSPAPSNSSRTGFNSSSISDSNYNTATISSINGAQNSALIGSNSQNSAPISSGSSNTDVYHTSPVASSGNSIVYQTSPISSSNAAPVASSSSSYNSAPINIGGSSYNIAPIRSSSNIFHRSPISGSSNSYNAASSSNSNLYSTPPVSSNGYSTAQSSPSNPVSGGSNTGIYDLPSSSVSSSSFNAAPIRSSSHIYNLPVSGNGGSYNAASFSGSYQQAPVSSSGSSTVYHTAPHGSHSGNSNYRYPVYYTTGSDRHNITRIDVDTAAAPSSIGNTEPTVRVVKKPFLIVVPNSSDYFETTTIPATITTTPITELPITETQTYPTTNLDDTISYTSSIDTTLPLAEDKQNPTKADSSSEASTEATIAVAKKPFLIVVPNSSDYYVETTTQDVTMTATDTPSEPTTYTESTESADLAFTTFSTDTATAFTSST